MRIVDEIQTVSGRGRARRFPGMLFRWARLVAPWMIFTAILFATLSPLGMRPRTGFSVHLEHFAAFGLLGVLYVTAFPKRIILVCTLVIFSAAALELTQLGLMDRHARFADFAVKLAGGEVGAVSAWLSWRFFTGRQDRLLVHDADWALLPARRGGDRPGA